MSIPGPVLSLISAQNIIIFIITIHLSLHLAAYATHNSSDKSVFRGI